MVPAAIPKRTEQNVPMQLPASAEEFDCGTYGGAIMIPPAQMYIEEGGCAGAPPGSLGQCMTGEEAAREYMLFCC